MALIIDYCICIQFFAGFSQSMQYNFDRQWLPSPSIEICEECEKIGKYVSKCPLPTWLNPKAPTSASREAFHPSGIFHAFSRMRFLRWSYDPRHPLAQHLDCVDVVTGGMMISNHLWLARHLRPLPCHSSLSIEGMKGQCHVASLTWWNDAKCENSEK